MTTTQLAALGTMSAAGIVANHVASRAVFADYQQRKSKKSLSAHFSDLATFAEYICSAGADCPTADELQNDPDAWQGVTWGLVAGFVQWMLGQGLALATVNRKLSTVKVYAGLAGQTQTGEFNEKGKPIYMIDGDELARIKNIKGFAAKEFKKVDDKRKAAGRATRKGSKKAKGAVLTTEQAKALKAQPDTPQGRRDAVMMSLLLDHGLRVGELAMLQVTDVDLAAGELRFYRPKVSKSQTHKLTKGARAALRAYMPEAPAMGPLLRGSVKGGALSAPGMNVTAITVRVGKLGAALGIDNLSAHDCRHFWATRAIRKGADPFAVLQAGGWTSMATVQKYVDETAIANAGIDDSGD